MCSSQSEADITSPLPRLRARRKASKVDFIDEPDDTDEETEKIEKLIEAEGYMDFFPSKVTKKKGRPRKAAIRSKDTNKTDDAKIEKNNNDDFDNIGGQELRSMNTTKHDISTDSNTSTASKILKMVQDHQASLPCGASGLVGPGQGPVQLNLQRPSKPKEGKAGSMRRDQNSDNWIVKSSITATESGNSSSVENKNSIKIDDTSVDTNSSVDIGAQSQAMINTSKCDTNAESSKSVSMRSKVTITNSVRDKVTKMDFVSGEAGDIGEENDNREKLVEAEDDTDFVPDEENVVQRNKNWECPRKVAKIENISRNDEMNYENDRTEEEQAVINLTMNDTSTDSNQSPPVKTEARFQQEPLHGGRSQMRPGSGQHEDNQRRSWMNENEEGRSTILPGAGKYQQSDNLRLGIGEEKIPEPMRTNNLVDVEGQKFNSKAPHSQTNKLFPRESTSGQSKPGQPRMLRPIRPKIEEKPSPRIIGPGQYRQLVSQSRGMVRKPVRTQVTGFRMPRPTSVTGLSGIVPRGGSYSHRRALSLPQNNNTQGIRAPSPQASHYPTHTQEALGKLSNMGTSFTMIQTPPPPASSRGEWNIPPGISISRIQEPAPGSGMTVPSLASALRMLGESEGTKRTVSYKLTENQIMAMKVLGFKQEP